MHPFTRHPWRWSGIALGTVGLLAAAVVALPTTAQTADADLTSASSVSTTTPIKHVVVLFDENESYDHYFGTYPKAANTDGTTFTAKADTPTNNNLVTSGALTTNANLYKPTRLSSAQALTCSQNHNYTPEQLAEDNGKMDKFVQYTSKDTCTGMYGNPGLAMDYYDGNTVTGLWNYAQNYALSDNSWDTTFGPSTPGALNLISGQTANATAYTSTSGTTDPTVHAATTISTLSGLDGAGGGTVTADPDPVYDDCADTNHTTAADTVGLAGKNIGDLLNAKGVTWGWFQGGFTPTTAYAGAGTYAACASTTTNAGGTAVTDYSAHHNPFEYYKSTSNPHHLAPSSDAMIGHTDQANHEYDLTSFSTALNEDDLPSVSFLKAPAAQDAHPGNSTPLDEQKFLTREINAIQKSDSWSSTAIVIAYDDSDGWYDHVAPTILNGSDDTTAATLADNESTGATTTTTTTDQPMCTTAAAATATAPLAGDEDRCGPSQRLPLLVISPYSKENFIAHTASNQVSITKFIEDNWSTGTIGDGSFDATAGSIENMFDFSAPQNREVLLASDGSVSSIVDTTPTVGPTASATPTASSSPSAGSTTAPAAASTTTVTVPAARYGSHGKATVHVASSGTVTGGTVTVSVGGTKVATAKLGGSRTTVSLPSTLKPGAHAVTASFGGTPTARASTGSATLTVTKAKTETAAVLSSLHPKRGSTHLRAHVTVRIPGVSANPVGTVQVLVGGHVVAKAELTKKADGRLTVKLPTFGSTGTQHVLVRYAATPRTAASQSHLKTVLVRK